MASNAQSLLLRLLQEIKDHIYVLVCGGDLLHSKFASSMSNAQVRHVKCLSKATEEDAQASYHASKSLWFDDTYVNRHSHPSSSVTTQDAFLEGSHWIYASCAPAAKSTTKQRTSATPPTLSLSMTGVFLGRF